MYHDDAGRIVGPFPTFGPVEVDPSDVQPPFAVKRIYVIYGTTEGTVRGRHAHKNLRQLAHCVAGACTMTIDGIPHRLDAPTKGVTLGPGQWREMSDFTQDCVLVVYADQYYDADDYIWERETLTA
ncbi:hypothetical protein GCM10022280_12410 [Sphingomonas swuensis]|uniref:Sugar 3,4-ketoisomerase QdtA cupin domain-containing protein n=1 Tax=Sphingomonas swuensis TaxID=977800 RepID=A0ABP7SRR3_9SPHN